MTKKISTLLIFILGFNLVIYAEREISLISDVALINSEIYSGPTPPVKILIAIDMRNSAFYKLSDKENVIKGGLFNQGLNIVSIEASNLFKKSGSHVYFLDLKVDDLIFRKEIEFDIQLESHIIVKRAKEERKNPEYKLSMFIGNELIVTSKKLSHKNLSSKIELPPLPENYSPFDPMDRADPALNSFSILSAVGLAYELIKKLMPAKAKEKRASSIQKQKQITTIFFRRGLEGVIKEIKAVITLKTKDL